MRRTNQGSNWIRRSTRLAIYARDGFKCVYCGARARPGKGAKNAHCWAAHLDHVLASELGGASTPDNLVTACGACNSAKRELPLSGFLADVTRRGGNAEAIADRVRAALRAPLDRAEGRRLAAQGK